ncbi:TIGR03618 family F420-dependent PPOX class oxidoreductase [Streptomyces sp. SID5770]|uniref:PPOX class F420-dependent oxidoreductase n=1 Tax=Streptomyces sp. SID5770 TaxID=2690308 RepID=UPI00136B379B|nr:PPOX class F420-dependent oxidoreductase [Streptomyces sp. SID5770]MZE54339.1 TIGR03618 family F420-dependent PPOX class oxidoreductase [Streptomyces sp. SID5770]
MGSMTRMTEEQWRTFVSAGTRTGKLATVRDDGSPHVVPVWFVLDGDAFVFNTAKTTVKGRNLARDGRVSLCVDDDTPPFSFVSLFGRAELNEEPDALRHWATRIGARYMGEDRAEEFGERNAVPGELLVRVRIDKVIAEAGLAD